MSDTPNYRSWEFDFPVEPGERLADYTARAMPFLRDKYGSPSNPPPSDFLADQAGLRWDAAQREARRTGHLMPPVTPETDLSGGKKKRESKNRPPPIDRPNMPSIEMTGGDLGRWIDEAEAALIVGDPNVFQYGDFIARIAPGPITTADGRARVALRIVRMSHQGLTERMSRVALFQRFDGRSNKLVNTVPPASIAQGYLERVGNWGVPALLGIASAPVFRHDGSILDRPGYDPQTCLFYDPRGTVFEPVPDRPTRDDAIAALNYIASLYEEVPFTNEASLSVALSANACAVVRFALGGMPLHGFNATGAGSGKSMCADIASILATGAEAPALSIGSDPEELKKSLGAELSAGAPVVSLDNCEYPVGGELVNQVLTQERVKVRILGMSRMVEIPRGALLLCNGNGLVIVGDLVRRTIVANIDPKSETPWTRTFRTENPVSRAKRERGALVRALLTVFRAYHVAGYPKHGKPPLGSFASWDGLVRGALIWCGRVDPCETMEHLRVADPKRANLGAVLHRWVDAFGYEELTAGDVIRRATDREPRASSDFNRPPDFMFPELREALLDVAGDGGAINSKRLGSWLRRNAGTVANGLRVEEGKFQRGYQFWRVREL